MIKSPSRLTAILLAVFVTVLWSTSWILIKFGLQSELPALTFAGLRYSLAFLFLLPLVAFSSAQRRALGSLTITDWGWLAVLGVFYYTLTQGAIFLSLAYLPAAMLNLLLNLTTVIVAIAGMVFLNERPDGIQWLGIFLTSGGVVIYFLPMALPAARSVGLIVAVLCVLSNAVSSLLGRSINRRSELSPLIITFVSMGIGSIIMLGTGLLTQGPGSISGRDWLIIAWLAVVNTALAFTLWNHTLRTLTAMESSLINSLMMPQVALLAWLFLGETLSAREIAGLILVGIGVLVVQLRSQTAHG